MEFLLKIIGMIGGFNGIQKALDGRKTYLACAGTILVGLGWISFVLYQFSQKQIDANTAYTQITVCGAAISGAVKGIFQRMATAKSHAISEAVLVAIQAQKPEVKQ